MVAFDKSDRIPSYALFNSLISIVNLLRHDFQLQGILENNERLFDILRKNYIFDEDFMGKFKTESLKKITRQDKTFYTGHLKKIC